MKKYMLTNESIEYGDITLHRIKAIRSFDNVSEGELGGWIEKEENLSHEGNCWIADEAKVFGDAVVSENARLYDDTEVAGNAEIDGNAKLTEHAVACGHCFVYGNAEVSGEANVSGYTKLGGNAKIYGDVSLYGDAWVTGEAQITSFRDVFWCANVGSSIYTIAAYRTRTGEIEIELHDFKGTVDEFRAYMSKTNDYDQYAQEYQLLIQFIELRFRGDE